MSSINNTPKSEMSMEELMALGSYFRGNIPEDNAEFEQEVMDFMEDPQPIRSRIDEDGIVIRPREKFVSSAPKGKKGTTPQWKYSKRQREVAELIDLAYDRLRGTPGVPEFSGGVAKTNSEIIQREVEKIKAERNPVVPKRRGRPPKPKVESEPKVPKKRGRPPKPKVESEPKITKKRGRPQKAKAESEPKMPKKRGRPPKTKVESKPKRETVAERFIRQNNTISKPRQSVADRLRAQGMVKPVIPADSVVTKVGPGKYNIEVNLNRDKPKEKKVYRSEVKIQLKRPARKAPDIPEGVSPWRPVPKPRTILPKERPVPKPRTILPRERPVPMKRPTPPIRVRKPVKQMKEVKEQPQVLEVEEHEIDPFGTDLQMPGHRKIETAANGASVTYSITPQYDDPINQLTSSRQVVRSILVNELRKMGGIKYTETLKVRMSKEVGNDKTKKDSVYFKSKTGTVTNFEDIEKTAAFNQQMIISRIESFQNLGSNWVVMNIESHYVNIAMYKPLAGSSYMELPEDISNSKCGLINMRNDDNMCFMWCHVRHLRPKARRATTITQNDRDFEQNLDYKDIEFPVKISDIEKIEKKNKINISVLGYKGKKKFYPIRISKEKYEDHMELLLLGDGEGKLHYVLVKDVNRLLCTVSKTKKKAHYCLQCFHN